MEEPPSSRESPSSSETSSSGGSVGLLGGGSKKVGKGVGGCSCPSSVHSSTESVRYNQCPVCLGKFDGERLPVALLCSHTICLQCAGLLVPGVSDGLDDRVGVVNYPLLCFIDGGWGGRGEGEERNVVVELLCEIARVVRGNCVSRSVHRKIVLLVGAVSPGVLGGDGGSGDGNNASGDGNNASGCGGRLVRVVKSLGERIVVELTSSCSHLSHYHAQQQLWAAIRARACQFMGPAMQDEALKLVLLALEDGSALSRKVLVMFVVQRLAPQFPQASKTSVGHIVQLLYRASAFDVLKRPGNSSLMTLRPEFRNYEALRREHDTQIMKIGLEAGIRFTPEQWSSLLYGDTSQKPLMQSIIDKLQSPQTFQELLKEYLVSVQRLSSPDSEFLVSLHPHFKVLAAIENETDHPSVPQLLESLHAVLVGLITFTANRKHQRTGGRAVAPNPSGNVGPTQQQFKSKQHGSQPHHHATHHLHQRQDGNANQLVAQMANLCV